MQSDSVRSASARRAAEVGPAAVPDVRDVLFAPLAGRTFAFQITATGHAVLSGAASLGEKAAELGIALELLAKDGDRLAPGTPVCRARANAWGVARAEETLMAAVGKASGVATAAAELVALVAGRARVVCGAWKKVPQPLRTELRHAVEVGGAGLRVLDRPFVYLDKNYVRMLGGVGAAVRQARRVGGRAAVVQLRGETAPIADEAEEAAREGAQVVMIDTGRVDELAAVSARRSAGRLPEDLVLAFGGGVRRDEIPALVEAGASVLDVGRAILDAPMADFRLDLR